MMTTTIHHTLIAVLVAIAAAALTAALSVGTSLAHNSGQVETGNGTCLEVGNGIPVPAEQSQAAVESRGLHHAGSQGNSAISEC